MMCLLVMKNSAAFAIHLITLFVKVLLLYSSDLSLLCVITVSEKCGITAHDLNNQPNFSTVFKNFIKWMQECLQEAQQEWDYHPRKSTCM